MAKKLEPLPRVKPLASLRFEPQRLVKQCECGKRYSLDQWRKLKFSSAQPLDLSDIAIELRHCAGCGSTIGITVHMVPCAVARLSERQGRGLP